MSDEKRDPETYAAIVALRLADKHLHSGVDLALETIGRLLNANKQLQDTLGAVRELPAKWRATKRHTPALKWYHNPKDCGHCADELEAMLEANDE